jgi:hypothetical protein
MDGPIRMAASAGAVGTGAVMAVVGAALLLFGLGLAAAPLFTASGEQHSSFLNLFGSGQSGSASFDALPLIGIVLVVLGAGVLLAGLKGVMHSFEKGKERDEGTKHTLVTERR